MLPFEGHGRKGGSLPHWFQDEIGEVQPREGFTLENPIGDAESVAFVASRNAIRIRDLRKNGGNAMGNQKNNLASALSAWPFFKHTCHLRLRLWAQQSVDQNAGWWDGIRSPEFFDSEMDPYRCFQK